jgi:hypothetical protein
MIMGLDYSEVAEKVLAVLDEMEDNGFVIDTVGVNIVDKNRPVLEVKFSR